VLPAKEDPVRSERADAPLAKKPAEPDSRGEKRLAKATDGGAPVSSDVPAAQVAAEPVDPVPLITTDPVPVARAIQDTHRSSAGLRAESDPQRVISQQDVDSLIDSFLATYRAGDITRFLQLFSSDVRTNGRTDLDGIRKDYQSFFAETDIREFSLADMQWNVMDATAAGQGKFNVGIRYRGDADTKNVSGTITFLVERRRGQLVFSEMFHSYR
jgi:hypothetical protein